MNTPITPVTDVKPIAATELSSVGDLELQAADAVQVAEVAAEYLAVLTDWVTSLSDRYAAAGFATAGLTAAVTAVTEATPAANTFTAVTEALGALVRETENVASLAEAAETLDATGDLRAFRAS